MEYICCYSRMDDREGEPPYVCMLNGFACAAREERDPTMCGYLEGSIYACPVCLGDGEIARLMVNPAEDYVCPQCGFRASGKKNLLEMYPDFARDQMLYADAANESAGRKQCP